jgi:hypothetical protein
MTPGFQRILDFVVIIKLSEKEKGNMMKKWVMIAMALIFTSSAALAVEVGGIELPDAIKAGSTSLIMNGAGLRTVLTFKVYGIGLYLKSKSSDGNAIINANDPMALSMKWRMKSPPSRIDETYYKSFATVLKAPPAKSYGPTSDLGPMTKDVVTFMGWIDKKEAQKNDVWTYIYVPGKGTEVYVNEKLMGTIPGLEFKKVLFSIWLSDKAPVGNGLKNDLLGK